jgi:hypothetical protein
MSSGGKAIGKLIVRRPRYNKYSLHRWFGFRSVL